MTDLKFETTIDCGWVNYWKNTKEFSKEEKIKYIKIEKPRQYVKCFGKDFSSYYEESLKISKNNKIYISKKYFERLYFKKDKVLMKINKNLMTLWDLSKRSSVFLNQNQLFNYYKLDWLNPYIGLLDFKRIKFSHIKKHKMSNIKDVLKFLYPNIPTGLILDFYKNSSTGKNYKHYTFINDLLNYVEDKNCINVEFNKLMNIFDTKYYRDIINMCDILNEKFKISWGSNRLKIFHDDLSKKLNHLKSSYKENKILTIKEEHTKLSLLNDSRIELITSSKRLLEEGCNLQHCVASYESRINSGQCAIYSIDWNDEKYTAEISNYEILQVRGFRNKDCPEDLYLFLKDNLCLLKNKENMAVAC